MKESVNSGITIMGIFEGLFKAKHNWEDVKNSEQVYPTNSISILTIKTEHVDLTTGWIDKGYDEYEFKKYCPFNFLIIIHRSDQHLDFQQVEDFFAEKLREVSIAHIIARVVSKESMSIEIYVDGKVAVENKLKEIQADSTMSFSFDWEVTRDPKWKLIKGLMQL